MNQPIKNILIIEDEEVLLSILEKKLTGHGFQVYLSRDGESGLKMLKEKKPDLILLDMVMPKMDGYEVLKAMKDQGIATPVIIISNSGQPVDIAKAMTLGARDYIVKAQLNPDEIIAKINLLAGGGGQETAISPAYAKRGGKKFILLAEDDMFLRDLCLRKLSKMGYIVETAIDGIEALEKITKNKPDLVLLDVIMPGLEGFEILKRMRENSDQKIAKTPVIILSNLGQEDDMKRGMELGANDYLVKANFTMDEIIVKIKKLI